MEETIGLEELAKRVGLELPAIRYYIYNKMVLKPDFKVDHTLRFKPETAAAFEKWYTGRQLTIKAVAAQIAKDHPQKTQEEWVQWLRVRIYMTKKLPKPNASKEFSVRLKRQITYELRKMPTQIRIAEPEAEPAVE